MLTIIRNGTIIDGLSTHQIIGDVVVEDDRIHAINVQSNCQYPMADYEIDATGCLVTPGFIDSHSHSDAYLIIEPEAQSKITQGITTEINGQCGGSIAPRYGEARLSSDWAANLGDKLAWRSLAEYRDALSLARPALNTIQFIGHNTLRSSVIGYSGRRANADELRRMKCLLEESFEEGGWGLSTGLIYQPGKYASNEEVELLVRTAAQHDRYYSTHMRSEGDRIEESIDEVLELVRKTGVKAEISHLKTSGKKNWVKIDAVLDKLQRAVDAGTLLGSDRYPYCAAATDLDVILPEWAQEGAAKAEMERLSSPSLRSKIISELNSEERDWNSIMVGGTWHSDNKQYCGKRIAEVANNNPGEFVCELLHKDGCKTGAFFFSMSEENLEKIYSRPWIVPGSDASLRAPWGVLGDDHPHPRAYATMPEFYRLTHSIKRMTSIPAKRFGIRDRGVIREGAYADILVWKEDEFIAKATYDKPHQFSAGMRCVMVNGVIAYKDGKFTGNRGGRFLER